MFLIIVSFLLTAILLILITRLHKKSKLRQDPEIFLHRISQNPILAPIAEHTWESEAVFNPAAFVHNGRVHLLYRAMGGDGISRIGYASSADGINFDVRSANPVYSPTRDFGIPKHTYSVGKRNLPSKLSYNTIDNPSGGGWGGTEDPRAVCIDGYIHMTFVAFDGWGSVRMALTSILEKDFALKNWEWNKPVFMSPPNETNKNWVLFPEKIGEKYAILHSISPQIDIEYVDYLNQFDGTKFIKSRFSRAGRSGFWDNWVRGAGPPPIKTEFGWLLFYHAMNDSDQNKYKFGAMLLDLNDPTKIIARANNPLLSPEEWYENDWKPGVVYTCGAVIFNKDLIIYYGGGDKYIAVAKVDLSDFLQKLIQHPVHAIKV